MPLAELPLSEFGTPMNISATVGKLALVVAFIAVTAACAGSPDANEPRKPKIIEVFACSDYCPGPEKKYLKKVYEGVDNEDDCLALGGKPYTYVGWGTFFVCVAE